MAKTQIKNADGTTTLFDNGRFAGKIAAPGAGIPLSPGKAPVQLPATLTSAATASSVADAFASYVAAGQQAIDEGRVPQITKVTGGESFRLQPSSPVPATRVKPSREVWLEREEANDPHDFRTGETICHGGEFFLIGSQVGTSGVMLTRLKGNTFIEEDDKFGYLTVSEPTDETVGVPFSAKFVGPAHRRGINAFPGRRVEGTAGQHWSGNAAEFYTSR